MLGLLLAVNLPSMLNLGAFIVGVVSAGVTLCRLWEVACMRAMCAAWAVLILEGCPLVGC